MGGSEKQILKKFWFQKVEKVEKVETYQFLVEKVETWDRTNKFSNFEKLSVEKVSKHI